MALHEPAEAIDMETTESGGVTDVFLRRPVFDPEKGPFPGGSRKTRNGGEACSGMPHQRFRTRRANGVMDAEAARSGREIAENGRL